MPFRFKLARKETCLKVKNISFKTLPIDAWKSSDKMRSKSWLIASFLLKTMFVCQTVLPMNVQEVSAQEMIENPEL